MTVTGGDEGWVAPSCQEGSRNLSWKGTKDLPDIGAIRNRQFDRASTPSSPVSGRSYVPQDDTLPVALNDRGEAESRKTAAALLLP